MVALPNQPLTAQRLKELFSTSYTKLVRTAYRLLQNEHDAEDVVQEVFITLWLKRAELQVESYEAYLMRSVYNASLNRIKKEKKTVFTALEEEALVHEKAYQSTDDAVMVKETGAKIDSVINSLPAACRTIFILSRFEKRTNKQIADELQLSVKTVENQMTKALRLLKNALLSFYFILLLKNIF